MSKLLSGTAVSVHIHVNDVRAEHHTDHEDGDISYRLIGREDDTWFTPNVYLTGSPEELVDFGRTVIAAAWDKYAEGGVTV